MAGEWQNMGHRMALHLVLERILAKQYADDTAGLAALEAACLSAVDHMPPEYFADNRRELTANMVDSLEALFGGARSLLR